MLNGIIIGIIIGVDGENPISPVYSDERVTDITEENRLTDDGYERITD
jgi:hypothetical protein